MRHPCHGVAASLKSRPCGNGRAGACALQAIALIEGLILPQAEAFIAATGAEFRIGAEHAFTDWCIHLAGLPPGMIRCGR
jgi:hypothetical protein